MPYFDSIVAVRDLCRSQHRERPSYPAIRNGRSSSPRRDRHYLALRRKHIEPWLLVRRGVHASIGRYHLDWGSADQPPVAPALAALMDAVAPGFRLALALPAALATGCAVLLAEQIAARTADVYRSLPQAQRDRTVVFGESYIIAAYLDGYSKRYRLPEAYSANRSYGYFPPPPADDDTVLYIGRDPAALRSRFADVRTLGDVGEDMHAYLLRGQRQSWARMWPQLRILTVT